MAVLTGKGARTGLGRYGEIVVAIFYVSGMGSLWLPRWETLRAGAFQFAVKFGAAFLSGCSTHRGIPRLGGFGKVS